MMFGPDGWIYLNSEDDPDYQVKIGDEVQSSIFPTVPWRHVDRTTNSHLVNKTAKRVAALGWDMIRTKNLLNPLVVPQGVIARNFPKLEWTCPCRDLKNDVGHVCHWCGAAEGAR